MRLWRSRVARPSTSARGGRLCGVTGSDPKTDLHNYLRAAREALLWKLEGLSEYDVRRPMVPTGTNLLGLIKHLAGVELRYCGDTFGRPHAEPLSWFGDDAEPNAILAHMIAETNRHAGHARVTPGAASPPRPGAPSARPRRRAG